MSLQNKNIMPPLWLAYPEIDRYSIGWRMGYGESYRYKFGDWWNTLSKEEQAEYQTLFPEPVTWKGWWKEEYTFEVFEHNEFCIPIWQSSGLPKYTRTQLQQDIADGKNHEFCLFWGHRPSKDGVITKSCLSQWWMGEFWSIPHKYCCMEQFMMEQKAQLFEDEKIRQQILESKQQNEIKKLGRKVQNFNQSVWDQAKYLIVLNGNWYKFSQNKQLKNFLLSTGDAVLVEASPYDAVWGIQLSADAPDASNPMNWQGENLLGFALMEVRDELRRVTQNESLCDWSMVEE